MNVVAVMPIKLKNERLPGKNTKLLGGKPLLQYQLDALAQCCEISEICVYCSDSSIIPLLPRNVHFVKRSTELDLPTSNFSQIFESFIKIKPADIYVFAHATAPFVSVATIKELISAVLYEKHDSAFCASRIQDFLWQNGTPLNFDPTNLPRSQDIQPIYRETSGVYVFKREVFELYHRRIGLTPLIKEVSMKESVDINTSDDFMLAEAMLHISTPTHSNEK